LTANQISDIHALSGLANLTLLASGDNQIADISALSGLTHLTALYLSGNQIADISPLVENAGIGRGDYVDVRHNSLVTTPESPSKSDIDVLQIRGVTVDFDPQN